MTVVESFIRNQLLPCLSPLTHFVNGDDDNLYSYNNYINQLESGTYPIKGPDIPVPSSSKYLRGSSSKGDGGLPSVVYLKFSPTYDGKGFTFSL